jgi:hypothetical protein
MKLEFAKSVRFMKIALAALCFVLAGERVAQSNWLSVNQELSGYNEFEGSEIWFHDYETGEWDYLGGSDVVGAKYTVSWELPCAKLGVFSIEPLVSSTPFETLYIYDSCSPGGII